MTIYSRRDKTHSVAHSDVLYEVTLLRPLRNRLLAPRAASAHDTTDIGEIYRIDGLLLRGLIEQARAKGGVGPHVLMSFFASTTGFLGQQIALEEHLPHIACVRGSDLARDFRNPYAFSAMQYVAQNADLVVTTNADHHSQLSSLVRKGSVVTIYNSVDLDLPVWKPRQEGTIRLVSDVGFSLKKGTHIMLSAVTALVEEGCDVHLTVFGRTDPRENAYWAAARSERLISSPDAFTFYDVLEEDQIADHLLRADIYCSASLGEGCSNSTSRALAIGIPIVATDTGALRELAVSAAHVRLCSPGIEADFYRQLRVAVIRDMVYLSPTDQNWLGSLRARLSPETERDAWRQALKQAMDRSGRGG